MNDRPGWQAARSIVLDRDQRRCMRCGHECSRGEADVHHLVPRSLGGTDEPANLVTLCDGCHGARHPNLQAALSYRFLERWALKLAMWLDRQNELPLTTPHLAAVLRLFGWQKFRGNQLEVILAALNGEDVLLVSPTASGKSLCFQMPTLMRRGTAFVIVPLKALMNDQVIKLQEQEIPASFINGDLGPVEKELRYSLLERHAIKFLYCTPERFDPQMVRQLEIDRLSTIKPSFLVVDEAHCIDRWGSEFRPNYSRLGAVRQLLGSPPVLAFTATAGPAMRQRLLQSLGIPHARVVVSGVNRPNIALLRLEIPRDEERFEIINWFASIIGVGRTMIFVPTVKIGNLVQEGLRVRGQTVPFFHSRLGTANDRTVLQQQFTGRLLPEVPVIICTNAFGMGLDVPDVRLVVHWQHPASVEDYLQEFGRAGRDQEPALAVLFTNNNTDNQLLEFMARMSVDETDLDAAQKTQVLEAKHSQIQTIHNMAINRKLCLRQEIKLYFGDAQPQSRHSLALRIVRWLFLARKRKPNRKLNVEACCDKCGKVTPNNFRPWVRKIFA